jgi:hypothetical protein
MTATAIHYGFTSLQDLRVDTEVRSENKKKASVLIEVEGQKMKPTDRFWRSIFTRYRISDSIFRYYSHQEVFERISSRVKTDSFRYCWQEEKDGAPSLLAISNPDRQIVRIDALTDLVQTYSSLKTEYHEGVFTSTHEPRSGEFAYRIGPDEFKNQYVLKMPVDGFGDPQIYLSLLRLICANGAVGYTPQFRSEIRAGKDPQHAITRALTCFDNAKGYSAMADRFEAAQASWASLHETLRVYRQLLKLTFHDKNLGSDILNRLSEITGRPQELYGLANLDALSEKKQRILPAKCRVYDLINFVTEIATHHVDYNQAVRLHGLVGSLLSDDYDLEGSAEQVGEFSDLFLAS